METVVIIPSRYGSQRLPKKPLALIDGVPLVERVYRRSVACDSVDRVVVATDHPEIVEVVQGFGGEVVMTPELCPSGTDRVFAAATALGLKDEIIVNVQGDEPLMEASVIAAVADELRLHRGLEVSTAVSVLDDGESLRSPNVVKAVLTSDFHAMYFSRSAIPFHRDLGDEKINDWSSTSRYYKHIGIYGYRMSALTRFVQLPVSDLERLEKLEQLRFLQAGIGIGCALVEYESVAVDTADDILKVESILRSRLEH